MRVVIRGSDLPGLRCGAHRNVHVALQVGSRPDGVVPGDAASAEWTTEIAVVGTDGERDFRGPAVHGRRGERFLYLTWGEYDGREFAMFRRAKLMLAEAPDAEDVVAQVRLTDAAGLPTCARLRDPMVRWVSR